MNVLNPFLSKLK